MHTNVCLVFCCHFYNVILHLPRHSCCFMPAKIHLLEVIAREQLIKSFFLCSSVKSMYFVFVLFSLGLLLVCLRIKIDRTIQKPKTKCLLLLATKTTTSLARTYSRWALMPAQLFSCKMLEWLFHSHSLSYSSTHCFRNAQRKQQ